MIKANQAQFPARALCETLGVSRSGYYDWIERPPSRQTISNRRLIEQILAIHRTSDFTYGRPRITAELADLGILANHKRVGRLMCKVRIRGVSRRRGFVITTHRNKHSHPAPYLVQRHFKATSINQLWVADMTYISIWAGFLYLAVVIDVFSRKVVGWSFGEKMTANLVISALNMALAIRKPGEVIHHSDHGSQGGFNRSSQHVYYGGVYGTTGRMDAKVDEERGDALARCAVTSQRD